METQGIRFVVEKRQKHLVPGLRIEVQEVYGREGLVAWNTAFEPGGC